MNMSAEKLTAEFKDESFSETDDDGEELEELDDSPCNCGDDNDSILDSDSDEYYEARADGLAHKHGTECEGNCKMRSFELASRLVLLYLSCNEPCCAKHAMQARITGNMTVGDCVHLEHDSRAIQLAFVNQTEVFDRKLSAMCAERCSFHLMQAIGAIMSEHKPTDEEILKSREFKSTKSYNQTFKGMVGLFAKAPKAPPPPPVLTAKPQIKMREEKDKINLDWIPDHLLQQSKPSPAKTKHAQKKRTKQQAKAKTASSSGPSTRRRKVAVEDAQPSKNKSSDEPRDFLTEEAPVAAAVEVAEKAVNENDAVIEQLREELHGVYGDLETEKDQSRVLSERVEQQDQEIARLNQRMLDLQRKKFSAETSLSKQNSRLRTIEKELDKANNAKTEINVQKERAIKAETSLLYLLCKVECGKLRRDVDQAALNADHCMLIINSLEELGAAGESVPWRRAMKEWIELRQIKQKILDWLPVEYEKLTTAIFKDVATLDQLAPVEIPPTPPVPKMPPKPKALDQMENGHNKLPSGDDECSLCLSHFSALQQCPNCYKFFHTQCVSEWLLQKSQCPLCRSKWNLHSEFPTLNKAK